MAKFKVSAEFDKKELKALDKDIDKLFTEIGSALASSPKMQPMVDKMRQGMTENAMKFTNHEIWANIKEQAKDKDLIDFDSPLMVTGQLVNDFIYYSGKPKVSQIPYSDEFVLGMFTWAAKERKRPTSQYILNELNKKRGGPVRSDDEVEKFTFIKTSDLVKIIMKSPRYPIMDSLVNLYDMDIFLFTEKIIDEVFKKKR